MIRAVLDTNVFVSALLTAEGTPARLVQAWREREFALVTSTPLLAELAAVLARSWLVSRVHQGAIIGLLQELALTADVVEPTQRLRVLADDPDNRLLEAAITGNADYVVTGDRQALAVGVFGHTAVVTPAQFFRVLNSR